MTYELILNSGGMRGFLILGALHELSKYHPIDKFTYYTGASVGAILSLLFNISYTVEEFKNIFLNIDFSMFLDMRITNLINTNGFDNGEKFNNFLKALILNKNYSVDITFDELYKKTGKILTVVVSNISLGIPEYHNYITAPNMSVLLSLKMSMTIPILFSPIKYNEQYYIDGGLLDPYPYYYHKNTKKIGILTIDDNEYSFLKKYSSNFIYEMNNTFDYLNKLIFILHLNYVKIKLKKIPKNTIKIFVGKDINGLDFDVKQETKTKLFKQGILSSYKYYKKILKKRRKRYLSMKYYFIWKNHVLLLRSLK
jgi:predicted acylesterase/phospholipase RssA